MPRVPHLKCRTVTNEKRETLFSKYLSMQRVKSGGQGDWIRTKGPLLPKRTRSLEALPRYKLIRRFTDAVVC